jgi:tRNA pseudouridine38-40 synthase
MPRCALLVEYDGTDYAGWQRQLNALTVQEVLENALESITGESLTLIGSGRTDRGVHGFGQVAHVDIPDTSSIPEKQLAKAINSSLPPDIRVRAAAFVEERFHARFQAVRREYKYTVCNHYSVFRRRYAWQVWMPFSPTLLSDAAEVFVGTHNFTTFSKHNPDTENYCCHVEKAAWSEIEQGVWCFHIIADRFVYGMVRSVVGAMMAAATNKRSTEDLREALHSQDRARKSPLAPSTGLVLWRVRYDNDPFAQSEHSRLE